MAADGIGVRWVDDINIHEQWVHWHGVQVAVPCRGERLAGEGIGAVEVATKEH